MKVIDETILQQRRHREFYNGSVYVHCASSLEIIIDIFLSFTSSL